VSPTHHERLDVLDGLRGIAIGLVVWYHAWLVYGWYAGAVNFLAEAGFLGVDLFFFISGFCLFVPYARSASAGRPAPSTARFFARRAVKIVPSYLLALVAFSVAYRTHFVSPEDAFVAIVSHLTFVHTLSPATYGAISGPLWTVGIEVQFYLLFPFIAFWFSRAPLLVYAALAIISETYRATIGGLGLGATFTWINQLPAYLDLFAAGMLGAYALVALGPRARQIDSRIWTIASIVLFGVVLAGAWGVSALGRATNISEVYTTVNMYRFLIGPVCLALALATSFAVARWRRCITARPHRLFVGHFVQFVFVES
jgi:peptidoglycan/LPS O-acetylase OafA/YrhL